MNMRIQPMIPPSCSPLVQDQFLERVEGFVTQLTLIVMAITNIKFFVGKVGKARVSKGMCSSTRWRNFDSSFTCSELIKVDS